MRPQVPDARRPARRSERNGGAIADGWRQITEGFRFLRGQPGAQVDLLRRPDRDDLRHAAGAVPRARGHAVRRPGPKGSWGLLFSAGGSRCARGRAHDRAGCATCGDKGLPCCGGGRVGLGIVGFGLAGDVLVLALVGSRRGRCRRRGVGGVPRERSSSGRCPMRSGAGCRPCTSSSWSAVRGWVTSKRRIVSSLFTPAVSVVTGGHRVHRRCRDPGAGGSRVRALPRADVDEAPG